jgi:hypothetical protein
VKKELVEGTEIQLDVKMMDYIGELYGVVDLVNETIAGAFEGSEDRTGTYADIQKSTLRLSALANIFDKQTHKETYKVYIETPYVTEISGDIALPKVNDDLTALITGKP